MKVVAISCRTVRGSQECAGVPEGRPQAPASLSVNPHLHVRKGELAVFCHNHGCDVASQGAISAGKAAIALALLAPLAHAKLLRCGATTREPACTHSTYCGMQSRRQHQHCCTLKCGWRLCGCWRRMHASFVLLALHVPGLQSAGCCQQLGTACLCWLNAEWQGSAKLLLQMAGLAVARGFGCAGSGCCCCEPGVRFCQPCMVASHLFSSMLSA